MPRFLIKNCAYAYVTSNSNYNPYVHDRGSVKLPQQVTWSNVTRHPKRSCGTFISEYSLLLLTGNKLAPPIMSTYTT